MAPALLRATSLRGKGGAQGFHGVLAGVLGFAPPGPLLDEKRARAQSEVRAGRPGVWGANVGVCRQVGRREYFFFLSPWMGPCCFFLCLCLQGIRMAWRGERGVSKVPYQGTPLSGYEERALDATSPGRGWFPMTG